MFLILTSERFGHIYRSNVENQAKRKVQLPKRLVVLRQRIEYDEFAARKHINVY